MNAEELKSFLVSAEKKDRLATSCLLYGGSAKERDSLGFFFCQLLLCSSPEKPCGKCDFCRQVQKNTHPDVVWVTPTKSLLSIDDVRSVKEGIYLKPYSGNRRIYIFRIDYMKEEASNAFLKILEEPPLYGFLLILTAKISGFLPTIVSRCQRLCLNFRVPEQTAEMSEAQTEFLSLVTAVREGKFEEFFGQIDALVKGREREEIEQWLDWAVWLYRDAFLSSLQVHGDLLVNKQARDIITDGSPGAKIESIMELKSRIKFNINLKIGLESLFFQLAA